MNRVEAGKESKEWSRILPSFKSVGSFFPPFSCGKKKAPGIPSLQCLESHMFYFYVLDMGESVIARRHAIVKCLVGFGSASLVQSELLFHCETAC